MPRKRLSGPLLWERRREVWERDGQRCVGPYCAEKPRGSLALADAQIDHIISGKFGSNKPENLRTLCRRCHVLRADKRHRGMISRALRDGLIPPDWRRLTWE